MSSSLDLGGFSAADKQTLFTAAKAELLRRASGGAVQTGASSGQSFSMTKMTEEGLIRLINSLTQELGYQQPEVRVRPVFSRGGAGGQFIPGV
jgi:hypothetical protein